MSYTAKLLDLAVRCENASPEQQAALLREAHLTVRGLKRYVKDDFKLLLNAQGYTDAALTLIPKDWWLQSLGHGLDGFRCRVETNGPPSASIASGMSGNKASATTGLSVCAAMLRAHAWLQGV